MNRMDEDAVERFFETYALAWRRNDTASLLKHWDQERFAYYKAEEIDHFFLSFNALQSYFTQNETLHDLVALQFRQLQIIPLADTLCLVITPMRWDIRFKADAHQNDGQPFRHRGTAMGGDNHIVALVALTEAGLRLRGWSETPDAAIMTMTQLYYRNVTPGF